MKQYKLTAHLPRLVLALGLVGLVLRWILYQVNLDARLLLIPGHPLEVLIWLLTAGTAALILVIGLKKKEPAAFEGNFVPSESGCIGCCAAAFLICYTALSGEAGIPGAPGLVWKVLGVLSVPALLTAGFGRLTANKRFFLPYAVPSLFFLFHIVTHYRAWSSEAQLQTYFFPLAAAVMLTLFLFYTAAFAVDLNYRRHQVITGLLGAFLYMVDLSRTDYPWLCLAAVILCLTSLCAMMPETKENKEVTPHDPA